MPETSDICPAARTIIINGYREMAIPLKLNLAMEMSETVINLAKAGIRRRYPNISQSEFGKWLGAILWGRADLLPDRLDKRNTHYRNCQGSGTQIILL